MFKEKIDRSLLRKLKQLAVKWAAKLHHCMIPHDVGEPLYHAVMNGTLITCLKANGKNKINVP